MNCVLPGLENVTWAVPTHLPYAYWAQVDVWEWGSNGYAKMVLLFWVCVAEGLIPLSIHCWRTSIIVWELGSITLVCR